MSQGFAGSVTINAGVVDSGNSSTAALDAAAVFTGTWKDVSSYSSISIAVATNQDGTYSLQFSPDASNVDSTLTRYYRTTQIEPPHVFKVTRKYARVVFTNTSASNQTYFRLQTLLGAQGSLNAPMDSVLAQDYDATVTRPTDYKYEVALSRRQGATTWNLWGYNSDVDIGTETVWAYGGSFARMTAADTLDVVSSSTNDDGSPAGTGAQSVIIYGIDENYLAITEVVTMDGTTPVTTSNQWLGVNRVAIYLAGSLGQNDGNITVTRTTGGSVQAYMPATAGTTQQAIFFVQDNHTALIDWLYVTLVKNAGGTQPKLTTKCWVTSLVSGARYEVFRDFINGSVENHTHILPSQPFVVGEKSMVEFQATTDVDNTEVSLRFSLIEVRDVGA
jgi:hypothetical protein